MSEVTPPQTVTVLYVEDDPVNQELMRHVVRKRPAVRLVIAGRGDEALDAAAAETPALILLDRNLPDMTGEVVLDRLRAMAATASIPVVVVSGDTGAPRSGELANGVIGYLTKPFRLSDLLAHIDRACAGSAARPVDGGCP